MANNEMKVTTNPAFKRGYQTALNDMISTLETRLELYRARLDARSDFVKRAGEPTPTFTRIDEVKELLEILKETAGKG